EVRARGHRMHGIKSWVGLPRANEEDAPSFQHVPKAALPVRERDGTTLRVVTGRAYGLTAPVNVPMEIFYVDAQLKAASTVTLPDDYAERGAMVVGGTVEAGGARHGDGAMIVFEANEPARITAQGDARVMLLGGAPLDGERHVWWNFVASSKERIEQAKRDWTDGRFGKIPGDDVEFIPLPANH
ncbi:MAG TPA: pirin-like C-terminal cupin domain-containing protein, partial [Rhizomicrobium sp.]